jgi:hypothetical protein
MLRRLVLTAAASAAALSTVPAGPATAHAATAPAGPAHIEPAHAEPVHAVPVSGGAARAEPVRLVLAPPPSRTLLPPPTRAEDSADRLTVTLRHAVGGVDRTYEVRCHPGGGSHPDADKACATLDRRTTWGKDPFAPVAPGTMCTMMYGGPATAHVTGIWAGRPVDARFDRADGCQIARWDALVPLLPGSHA